MWFAVVLSISLYGAARAEAPTIPMPANLSVAPQAANVPANVARFLGAWAGGAWDGVLPHVLIVEAVDGAGRAEVVYAVGDSAEASVTRGYRRVSGRIVGDLLSFDLTDGASVAYHNAGESLRGTFTSSRRRYTVTLRRATLAEASSVPAAVPDVVTGTTLRIPMKDSGRSGKPVTLEASLYRPKGDGPYRVLLFNHGSTGAGTVALSTTLRPSRLAQFFVQRGFAVLAPMRRGRGASDGAHEEYEGTCTHDVLRAGIDRALEDLDAAVAYLRTQPWADSRRVLVGGQSRGGMLSVVYAAERPGSVRGVINFAGGWTSQRCDVDGRGFNHATFALAGSRGRVPMLWLYAEQDSYYAPARIRGYHDAFTRAGGEATLHVFPAFDGDGHRLVDRGDVWNATAEDFLRRLNLLSR